MKNLSRSGETGNPQALGIPRDVQKQNGRTPPGPRSSLSTPGSAHAPAVAKTAAMSAACSSRRSSAPELRSAAQLQLSAPRASTAPKAAAAPEASERKTEAPGPRKLWLDVSGRWCGVLSAE